MVGRYFQVKNERRHSSRKKRKVKSKMNERAKCWQEQVSPLTTRKNDCPYNSSFTYKEIGRCLWNNKALNLSDRERTVLNKLLRTQGPTGELDISTKRLAEEIGMTLRTAERILQQLEEKQIIECKVFFLNTKKVMSKRRQINVRWNALFIDSATLADNVLSLRSCSSLSSDVIGFRCVTSVADATPAKPPLTNQRFTQEEEKQEPPQEESVSSKIKPSSLSLDRLSKLPSLEELSRLGDSKESISDALLNHVTEQATKVTKKLSGGLRESDRVSVREIREEPLTKAQARLRRLDKIPEIYPNYQEVLDREECTLNQLRWRMWDNWEYEPFTNEEQWWNPSCHADYALMDADERDREFMRAFEHWMAPKPFRYTTRQMMMFRNTRIRADSVKAKYHDYVAAQYEYFGAHEITYERVCCKCGDEIYKRWRGEQRGYPENYGCMRVQNKKYANRLGGRPRKRGSFDEELERQRKEIGPIIARGYVIKSKGEKS